MQARKLTAVDIGTGHVTFAIRTEPDDLVLEDHFDDPETVAMIRERLEAGDDSAWCTVFVTAYFGSFKGRATLGACCLTDTYTAEDCAKEYDLHADALADLNSEIADATATLAPLVDAPCPFHDSGNAGPCNHCER